MSKCVFVQLLEKINAKIRQKNQFLLPKTPPPVPRKKSFATKKKFCKKTFATHGCC